MSTILSRSRRIGSGLRWQSRHHCICSVADCHISGISSTFPWHVEQPTPVTISAAPQRLKRARTVADGLKICGIDAGHARHREKNFGMGKNGKMKEKCAHRVSWLYDAVWIVGFWGGEILRGCACVFIA